MCRPKGASVTLLLAHDILAPIKVFLIIFILIKRLNHPYQLVCYKKKNNLRRKKKPLDLSLTVFACKGNIVFTIFCNKT
jgi:hypothetical protein